MKRAFILTSKNGYSTIEVPEETWEAFKEFYDNRSLNSKTHNIQNYHYIKKLLLLIAIVVALIFIGIYIYFYSYLPQEAYNKSLQNLKNGFVIVNTFDCPKDHPIKAHLGSMIYHVSYDPYYSRTNAANGYCFDTTEHAKQQGFRRSYNQ